MNIVLACEIFPPDIGGPATYATQLADALIRAEHTVRVITYGEVKKPFPYPVVYVSRRIPFFLRQFVYFIRLWKMTKHVDLIYAQGPSVGPAVIFVKWLKRVKVVVKYVGDQGWQQVRMGGGKVGFEEYMKSYGRIWFGWKIRLIQWWQAFSFYHAENIVVPSQYLKHIMVDYHDVRQERVVVIPNGVAVREEAYSSVLSLRGLAKQSQQAHLNEIAMQPTIVRNDDKKNILYVGRLENWKGIKTLLYALRSLPDEYSATIVGDGSLKKELELQATSYKLQDRVSFVGRIPHNELEHYVQNAFCLYEGTEYEGMPHIVLESWSFGVPVIVSDFPANTELVNNGETGLVFRLGNAHDLAEKIQMLNSDEKLWDRLSKAGFEEHKKYDKENIMKQTMGYLGSFAER